MNENKRIKNLIISFVLVFAVAFSFTVFPEMEIAYAAPGDDANVDELKDNLSDVSKQQDEVERDLASVAKKITALQAQYDATNAKVNATQKDIDQTKKAIRKKQEELTEREENLNARLVVMYKNGSIGFVDVLLGSNSITEFVSNIETIQKIYQNDAHILEVLQKEYDKLEKTRRGLEEKVASL